MAGSLQFPSSGEGQRQEEGRGASSARDLASSVGREACEQGLRKGRDLNRGRVGTWQAFGVEGKAKLRC